MERANVTSIDALEAFRSNLILFLSDARQGVDEVADTVRRTRGWVQNDQRTYWQNEMRRRKRVLDQAEQDLFSAKLSSLRDNIVAQEVAVRKARQAHAESEEKLRRVKYWTRNFDHHLEPLAKRLASLRDYLDQDMPKAVAWLTRAQKTLESYAETGPVRQASKPHTEESPPPAAPTEDSDVS